MNPPSEGEIEITLLGRGVGESVVVHLPNGEWMIVDSFLNGNDPAARTYLDRLGVDPGAVTTIVITHFHRDHYEGIDRLMDYYRSCRLMVTSALSQKNFRALFSSSAKPILGKLPIAIKLARDRPLSGAVSSLRHLQAGQGVVTKSGIRVTALSPSDAAILESNLELGAALSDSIPEIKSRLSDDNRCSIVLYLEIGEVRALLGADMLAAPAAFGWQALLDDPNHEDLSPCSLVKAPHHGAISAHYQPMWDKLVSMGAVIQVAPFCTSNLPRDSDIDRMRRAGDVWQAAPSLKFEPIADAGDELSPPATVGVVQARRRVDEDGWRIVVEAPAFLASLHAGGAG